MARDRHANTVLLVFHGLSAVQLRGKIDFLYSCNKLTSDVISYADRPPCQQKGKCSFTSNGAQSNPYSVTVPKVPDIHFAERAFFFGSWADRNYYCRLLTGAETTTCMGNQEHRS